MGFLAHAEEVQLEKTFTPPSPYQFEWTSKVSIFSLAKMELAQNNANLIYQELTAVPLFNLGFAYRFSNRTPLDLWAVVQLGYGTKYQPIEAKLGLNQQMNLNTRVHWIPTFFAIRTDYRWPLLQDVYPFLTVGYGHHWIFQRSTTPGFNTNFDVSFFVLTPGMTFLLGTEESEYPLQLSFGTSFHQSLSNLHQIQGLSFDLSLSLLL